MINRFYSFFEQKSGDNYLNIDDTSSEILKKCNQVFNNSVNDNDSEYEKDYMKIKFYTNDDIPLNKMLYFPKITV